jgi:hypothetical protein
MTRGRLWGYFAGATVVAALVGFLFGWYQAYPAQHSRDRAMLRLRLSEARARTHEARIALGGANYGNARTHVGEAIRLLDAFKASNERDLPPTEATKVDLAQQLLKDALEITPSAPAVAGTPAPASPSGEQQADAKAQQAANLLGEVYRATPEP